MRDYTRREANSRVLDDIPDQLERFVVFLKVKYAFAGDKNLKRTKLWRVSMRESKAQVHSASLKDLRAQPLKREREKERERE